MDTRPIGVFDSGVGGLTVLHECLVTLPHEDFIYFGDSAPERFPYGTKPAATIRRFAHEVAQHLIERDVKLLVVACNSATAAALPDLQREFTVPLIGVITPEAHAAVQATRARRVGVMATEATVASGRYPAAIGVLDAGVEVSQVACPELVPLIQSGDVNGHGLHDAAKRYAEPLKQAEVDTVILGCTHYPLIRPMLQRIFGRDVTLITSAEEIAREVAATLERRGVANLARPRGQLPLSLHGRRAGLPGRRRSLSAAAADRGRAGRPRATGDRRVKRADGRELDQLRPLAIEPGFIDSAHGSVLFSIGKTRLVCTAMIEESVPGWMRGRGTGWVTSEYGMLPGSTSDRKPRDASRGKLDGRTVEIQRLIGRSLRSVVDFKALGERTIWIDCDVLQADGGTRCAAICGGYAALHLALSGAGRCRKAARATAVRLGGGRLGRDRRRQSDARSGLRRGLARGGRHERCHLGQRPDDRGAGDGRAHALRSRLAG